ncbi:MAG: hypothetical protein KKB13_26960 [Chloroflexi bacterium]|nr:hypothetical protein [Chloroflexota bacterium]
MTQPYSYLQVVGSRLQARQLLRYSALPGLLQDSVDRAHEEQLWQVVFGMPPPHDSAVDPVAAFLEKVHHELFPIDLPGSEWGIRPFYIAGRGVPWEIVDLAQLAPCEQVMVAVVCAAGVPARDVKLAAPGRRLDRHSGVIRTWWARRLYDVVPRLTWPRHPETAMALLAALDPPLDGLAALYQGVVKGTGNPFLDLPSEGIRQADYAYDTEWDWWIVDPSTILDLAQAYAAVRPALLRLEAYATWWQSTGSAGYQVRSVLVDLEHSARYATLCPEPDEAGWGAEDDEEDDR